MLRAAPYVPGHTLGAAADQCLLASADVRKLRRDVLNTALRVPHPRSRLLKAELLHIVELAARPARGIKLHLHTVGEVTSRRDPLRVGPVARCMNCPRVNGD